MGTVSADVEDEGKVLGEQGAGQPHSLDFITGPVQEEPGQAGQASLRSSR